MRYAPLVLLLLAPSAFANGEEWRRQPITPADYCEIDRIARLTQLSQCELIGVAESERQATNRQVMMQYNGLLPAPMPLIPTPAVAPPARGGLRRFFP